jgi:hypothetical protein
VGDAEHASRERAEIALRAAEIDSLEIDADAERRGLPSVNCSGFTPPEASPAMFRVPQPVHRRQMRHLRGV